MSEAFVGEIRMFAGSFAPRSWAKCDGQLLAVRQNDELFSLFGTTFGGDGETTFALPDMRGRIPIHQGLGPGLSPRNLGTRLGAERALAHVPPHTHPFSASADPAGSQDPALNTTATLTAGDIYSSGTPIAMSSLGTTDAGGGVQHQNLMPTLCVCFIVALVGNSP